MAAISATDAQLAAPVLPATTTSSAPAAAAPQASAPAAGFSGASSFDPVEGTMHSQNSEASSRSGLAQGDFKSKEGILASSNGAWSWHKLKMEMIALLK